MPETTRFKNEDLVLRLRKSVNPKIFNMGRYEPFLDALCADREYQKEAIRNVCNFLFGWAYNTTKELAKENYTANATLQEKYAAIDRFERVLEFPDKLACSVDLATGTGKSFVMYGIARIALAAGKVDRVLILCPSNTIEAGLFDKFRHLSKEADFTQLLRKDAGVVSPRIINATETITTGDICIENIHATYQMTKSAINDSLRGKGERTLVMNDEAHHIFTPEKDQGLKKWKEFLISDVFGFKYLVGLSGTCYIKNEYFTDVIVRYSLRQAIEDGFIKSIDYVVDDSPGDQKEKWQKIYANHQEARRKYRRTKPLTIIVTKDISACKDVTDELTVFLAETESISIQDAAKKVMRVHTPRSVREDREVAGNITRLRNGEPDRKGSPIEWITSVSMLTEGWDVQNVFQIYPHEKRAFESKLLIAQVLGRGLRIPDKYKGEQVHVTVFNHANWSRDIKDLVNEVLEIERRVCSFPVVKKPDYNFNIHQIAYDKSMQFVKTKQESEYNFDMSYVALADQRKELERATEYENAVSGGHIVKTTRVKMEMFPIDDVVEMIVGKFRAIDLETGSSYAKKYSRTWLRKLIRESLDRIGYKGNEVSKQNRQMILSAFGNLYRRGSKTPRPKTDAGTIYKINTLETDKTRMGFAVLKRGIASVFYDELSKTYDVDLEQALKDLEDDDTFPRRAITKVSNRFNFKTCQSIVLTHSEPEFKFVKALAQQKNAEKIKAWLKSPDSGFYEIEYAYASGGGDYTRRGFFNPDFFILLNKEMIVVEIKGDEEITDPSWENKGKRRAAITHFDLLNKLQDEIKYHFCFLSPEYYDHFFAQLQKGSMMNFQSSLDVALLKV